MASKDNLALDLEHGVRRWDRQRWISVFSSHNPTIREVTECLGLGLSASSSTTNRGIPKFDNPDYRKLSSEVTKTSKELPKERDALLDFAADPTSLDTELEGLLAVYGPAIWGKDADRSCLLTPDSTKKTYNQDLFFNLPEHKEILKIHLHRWIIIKACYYIRNMKLKRPSGANDYDTLADMEGEAGSPHETSLSHSPPQRVASAGAELEVNPTNFKKRKSSARGSLSDGEEHSTSPAKRPYSTLPLGASHSPRKTLRSLYPAASGSIENAPPFRTHHASPPPNSAPDVSRIHLSTLVGNTPNGLSCPPAILPLISSGTSPTTNGGHFTTVDSSTPVREVRVTSRAQSREPQLRSSPQNYRDAPSYSSPYEPCVQRPATTQDPAAPRLTLSQNTSPSTTQASETFNSPRHTERPSIASDRNSPPARQPRPQILPRLSPQIQHPPQSVEPSPQPQLPSPSQILAQTQVQPQQQLPRRPSSRAGTPSATVYGRALAPLLPSRSSTPIAQAASNLPPSAPLPSIAPALAHIVPAPVAPVAPVYAQQPVLAPQIPPVMPVAPHGYPIAAQLIAPQQAVLKSQLVETFLPMQTSHATPGPAIAHADLRLLQCEVTAGLFTFFYPRSSAPPDEPTLLQRLHTLWYHGASLFERELGPHFELVSKILTSWLHERQAITALRHSLASQPGASPAGLIDRLLAMNDLRVMRLKWKNMSTVDGMSPEDLLCMAFRVMTNTEGSEYLFKDGLDRLNGGVFEFLRTEDAKISMHRR